MLASRSDAAPIWIPGRHAEGPVGDYLSGTIDRAGFEAASPTMADPVYDRRPFYFARDKPWGLPDYTWNAFLWLMIPAVILFLIVAVAGRPRGGGGTSYAASVGYFSSLGLGYIMVELALLQHLILLVGHPIYTLSVILFSLLAASGLGSLLSDRFEGRAAGVCAGVSVAAVAYTLIVPEIVHALMPASLELRLAATALLVLPLGIPMGMPYPIGLRMAGQGSLRSAPFYWGLNGIMSVLGSLLTVLVAVQFGFGAAMLAGAACYAAGALSMRVMQSAKP
jgi:hypothetical protein